MALSDDLEYCRGVIPDVSRTFAISIGRLPKPKDLHIGVPYLLCRVPDTIEDSSHIPTDEKCSWLDLYAEVLKDGPLRQEKIAEVLLRSGAYHRDNASWKLVGNSDRVFRCLESFPTGVKHAVRENLTEMVMGMREFVSRYDNKIRIATLDEFSRYCYFVAGTVGKLLTEVFDSWYGWSPALRGRLDDRAVSFGEALQAVNILKDIYTDFHDEDSIYIPRDFLSRSGVEVPEKMFDDPDASTAAIRRLVIHAVECLYEARSYIQLLPTDAIEAREFCIVPYLLAVRTVHALQKNISAVLTPRGCKISRLEVGMLLAHVPGCIRSNDYFEKISAKAFEEDRILCA